MADQTETPPRESPLRRLSRRGVVLLVAAGILAVMAMFDLVAVAGALILLAAVALAMAFLPIEAPPDATAGNGAGNTRENLPRGTRALAASLPDPCFILGADGQVRFANDRAVATFGITEGEFLLFRLRQPELLAAFDKVVKGGGAQQVRFEERVPTERSFSAWFAALDETSAPGSILLVVDDLTAFHATERMRVDFVANASHELRTPLASLAGFVETLQGPARNDPAAQARFLAIMHEQATRMSRLIDDLLSLSRVELRAHLRPRDRADLILVLRHVVDTMTPLARDLGVVIEADIPAGQAIIHGDRDELIQVFDNLVINACKYGQSGGRVVIRMTVPERRGPCSVSVIDFGPGIATEHLPRLTERFYRIDDDLSRKHRGTGLGLAIVKHIVTRHRGKLHIESRLGAGAEFRVEFPEAEFIHVEPTAKTEQIQAPVAS
ncbi:MAG: two-component sensor histidine kinase [Bauldia sp.]|nr:two-component sensor histidine kinase [Bauldia sp.]